MEGEGQACGASRNGSGGWAGREEQYLELVGEHVFLGGKLAVETEEALLFRTEGLRRGAAQRGMSVEGFSAGGGLVEVNGRVLR